MSQHRVVIAGGGAAGFFAAITCAEMSTGSTVCLLERNRQVLDKVRISGGGRCNVTHACFDPKELMSYYPRGGAALRGALQVFQPRDTIAWFQSRGVKLKTEADGRMFPVTDSSRTILDCLVRAAQKAGVQLRTNCGLSAVARRPPAGFEIQTTSGDTIACDRLMLATGGCRGIAAAQPAVSLGHNFQSPVPSLFAFDVSSDRLGDLAGISLPEVEVAVPGLGLRELGPLLITHSGFSGPAVLKLSAWGAREFHRVGYKFPLQINWLPQVSPEVLAGRFESLRKAHPARLLVNTPFPPLPARLWHWLMFAAGVARETRWASLSRSDRHRFLQQLTRAGFQVVGKTLNQDEFVTCGGVRLGEVDFKTMGSRVCPGLYFGGELLDIDGLTGGFNFQAAWTTGWIAGRAMSAGWKDR